MTSGHDHRKHLLWRAALLHRLSGLALALFLPLHFLTLSLAIGGEATLDAALRWSDNPAVKLGEVVLLFLLVVHMLGGMRVLAVENLSWLDGQKRYAATAAASAAAVAVVFLVWLL